MIKTAKPPSLRCARPAFGCALAFLAASVSALSAPLWKIDLDSMPTGQVIQTASYAAQAVNTKPQSAGSQTAGGILVTENYKTGSARLSGHSVVLTKTSTGSGSAATVRFTLLGSAADFTAPTDYELRFDALLSQSALNAASSLAVRLSNTNSGGTYVGSLFFGKDGKFTLTSSYAEDFATDMGVWDCEKVLRFKIQVDASNKRFNVIMNDKLIISRDLEIAKDRLGIRRIFFGANSDNMTFVDGVGITNIETFSTLSPLPRAGSR